MNKRIFVEKRAIFDVESRKLTTELQQIVPRLKSVKIYNIYDLFGLNEADFEKTAYSVFADPVTDILQVDLPQHAFSFAVEYLPGQFDQRADSAEQCLALLLGKNSAKVRTAKLYAVEGILPENLTALKKYLVNRVESRIKNLELLEFPAQQEPEPVKTHQGFKDLSEKDLADFYERHGFSFGFDDLLFIQSYFKTENRNPTETELRVLDTYWSDHCRHTTFETELIDISFKGEYKEILQSVFDDYLEKRKFLKRENKPVTLMDLATVCGRYFQTTGKLDNLVVSDEINACTIEIEAEFDGKKEPWYLLFKNETHNHPTEIEPFGGASTCLGGAIRDPLSGRAFVYQAMRVSGAANVLEPIQETLPGKLPQQKISKDAAHGYSSYGNQIGLATTAVSEFYHEGYRAKRLEVGFVVGAVKKENVRREKPAVGDVVIVLGGATGKDGVGGATGSSREQDATSLENLSTEVQKGNPVEERKIQRLFREPAVTRMIKKSNDFGAGGVAVAIGEIADSLEIDLDVLPVKYQGLNGTELAISESQERMAVVIEKEDAQRFISLCAAENIMAVQVAEITNSGRLQMVWRGEKIVDLSREFLNSNGCLKKQNVEISHLKPVKNKQETFNEDKFLAALKDMNVASQKGLVEMFDASVGGTTVTMPFGGKYQLTETEGSAQTLPIPNAHDVETISLAAWGFDVDLSAQNSFLGAAYAVVESVAKIVAMGGDYRDVRLSFQEYFEKLGDSPEKWGKPLSALLGAYDAQMKFGLAAIGGKDSMSGTYHELNVPPTLISFACAPARKKNVISPEFKKAGNKLYFFEHQAQVNGLPDYQSLSNVFELISAEIARGNIVSVKTVKKGGLAVALAKMSFGNQLGANISADETTLLEKNIGSLVIESREDIQADIFKLLGEVTENKYLIINGSKYSIENLLEAWSSTFRELFSTVEGEKVVKNFPAKSAHSEKLIPKHFKTTIAKPRVFVPVFPGTNCEYETQNAFLKEGAEVRSLPLVNLNHETLKTTLKSWTDEIEKSQILVFSGGFSAGDEPDGSAKFIVTILKNEMMRVAVEKFLERDGLILGICNGFQALVKSGLLPFGKISTLHEGSATLAHNAIGRHISQMVDVKVLSDHSPWLRGMKDQIFTIPVSHGEGRFIASDEVITELVEGGQVATQYVDLEGNVSHGMPFNPNNSYFGIEGLTSPDGKIFGRMGHPERFAAGLMKNIPSVNYHNIFKNGLDYFK